MKERVKAHGGNVEGVLRFSIQWNDNKDTNDDLDAHCLEPRGNRIYFNNMKNARTGGVLDVDIVNPREQIGNQVAVENITWPDIRRMQAGRYQFMVHQYMARGGKAGFSAEIEFNGEIHPFTYVPPLRQGEFVAVADVTLSNGEFKIKEHLKSEMASREIWGLSSQKFHPVTACMYSPNYWDEQDGIGHRHYMFMIDGCKNPENPNGFFNEFLSEDLMKHKRVFEALGSKMRVESSDNQMSDIGFSATKRASLVVRVRGSLDRVLRLNF